ncbi:MAG: hypothetical protein ABIN58_04275 [candidate division WOR-3 bacterium]
MTLRFSTYIASHFYPQLKGGILLHGYSGAVDWVKPEIAQLASPGAVVDPKSLHYDTLTMLKVRGHLTQHDPAEEGRHVRELLRVLRARQAAPFELILSKHVPPRAITEQREEDERPPVDRIIDGLQTVFRALVPQTKTRRLVRVTLSLSESVLFPEDLETLLKVISHLVGDPKLLFEFYIRLRDTHVGWLSSVRDRLPSVRELEVLADRQSVANRDYSTLLMKNLSSFCYHPIGHATPHPVVPVLWVYHLAEVSETDLIRAQEIAGELRSFGINPIFVGTSEPLARQVEPHLPLLDSSEYALLPPVSRFLRRPIVFSFYPYFSRVPAFLSVGLNGRYILSRLPYSPDGLEWRSLTEVVEVWQQVSQAQPVEGWPIPSEGLFCLQCAYCLICSGNPFVPQKEIGSTTCFEVFHRKIKTILSVIGGRRYESE